MEPEIITSVKNPLIRRLRALGDRAAREREGMFLVEGEVMLLEALSCGLSPAFLLYEEGRLSPETQSELVSRGARSLIVARQVLEAVCQTRTPQGACCAFRLRPEAALEAADGLLVALDGVQDPGNVGTIWRTADAAGFQGLLLGAGCADPMGPKVQRAAMGSSFRLPYWRSDDLARSLKGLRERGYAVIVSTLDGDPIYERPPLPPRFALVVGSEARGASEAVRDQADMRLKLPMRGGAESLNAAMAAGIMMYELTRERPAL